MSRGVRRGCHPRTVRAADTSTAIQSASVSDRVDRSFFGTQEPDAYFWGETIEKLGPKTYRIRRGGFSTCVQPTPRWELVSNEVTLTLEKHAFIKMQFLARERCYPRVDNRIILFEGRPVGRLQVDRGDAAILLRDIEILTEFRNAGIGSRLIKDLMQEATAAGKPIGLHVLASSPAARLYERLGFVRSGGDAAYLEMKWVPATS